MVRKPYLYIFKANIAMISNCLCACPICNLRPSLHFFFFSPLNAVKDNCILISLSSCRDRKTCFKQGKCWSFPTTQRKKRKKVDDTSNIFGIRSEICCVHQLWHSIHFQITFLLLLQHSEMKFLKMNEVTQLTPFIFFSSNAGREKKNLLINGTLVTHHALLQKYMHFICYRNENLNQWKCSLSTSKYAYGKNDNDVLAEKTQKKTDFVKIAMLFFFRGLKRCFTAIIERKIKNHLKLRRFKPLREVFMRIITFFVEKTTEFFSLFFSFKPNGIITYFSFFNYFGLNVRQTSTKKKTTSQ